MLVCLDDQIGVHHHKLRNPEQ